MNKTGQLRKQVQVIANVTHGCNLQCPYCYYKSEMDNKPGEMKIEVMETLVRRLASASYTDILVMLHGGEPFTRGLSFFRETFDLLGNLLWDRRVCCSIQTNGTFDMRDILDLIDNCRFKDLNIHFGFSLDGPPRIHDSYRKYKRINKGSFDDIANNMKLMEERNIGFGVLNVYHEELSDRVDETYFFYKNFPALSELDFLLPYIGSGSADSDNPHLGSFLCELFDLWFRDNTATFNIRLFKFMIFSLLGMEHPRYCAFHEKCLSYYPIINIDIHGNASPCDSFPEITLGNIFDEDMETLMEKKSSGIHDGLFAHTRVRCASCKWVSHCNGGCPKNIAAGNQAYCGVYRKLFAHINERLESSGLSGRSAGSGRYDAKKFTNPVLRNMFTEMTSRRLAFAWRMRKEKSTLQ